MYPPATIRHADDLIVESTYANSLVRYLRTFRFISIASWTLKQRISAITIMPSIGWISRKQTFLFQTAHLVTSMEGSKRLNTLQGSMLILSASGMATGGRVVHHLKAFAPDPRNTLLFIGFQAAGTRSDTLLDGVKHIKIHGEYVPVHVQATSISNLSAHADYEEMLAWLSGIEHTPNIRSSLTASLWRPTPCARRLRKRWDGQSRSRNTCRP